MHTSPFATLRSYLRRSTPGIFILCILWHAVVLAGTTGKISGRVTGQNNEPLPSVNVIIAGTTMGAATDPDGYYTIINIPPGKYTLRFSLVSYRELVIERVSVSADNTTKQDAVLAESAVEVNAVVVTADQPVVEVNLTSAKTSVTAEQIQTLPVQDIQDVVNLQAGVVDGHFRGGRLGEVQYQVNGVTVNNPYDNSSTLRLDRSLLQEVQVISGTFDAEYGQAMSGVVNAVLKAGGDRFAWNAEVYSGDYLYPGAREERLVTYKFRPGAIQSYQMSLSGPLIANTTFLLNGRRAVDNGWYYGTRRFLPTDTSNFEQKIFYPTGDGKEVSLFDHDDWSGLVKVTNRSIRMIDLSYQAIVNVADDKRGSFAWRYNPDGVATAKIFSIVHGLDLTHTLSASTFYNLSVRNNFFDYKHYYYEAVDDPRYFQAGIPQSDPQYETDAIIQGIDLTRFVQKTNALVLKATLTTQATREHLLKGGAELQLTKVEFGAPGYLLQQSVDGVQTLTAVYSDPPDYPGILANRPVSGAAYVQDQIEWNDLNLRAGVRAEFFDARSTIPSDLANPANSITGVPQSVPKATTRKYSVAPRLGVSYPITTTSAIFFAYGHFYQYPALGTIFTNSDYAILRDLQAGQAAYSVVMGNPDIKPERTVQYEFGYKNAITENLGLDVSIFYKDIRDLLGVEFISTYAASEYTRFTNVDFGNVVGFTITLDQRRLGLFDATVDYTWQTAQGNSSDPRETATRASAGEDPRPQQQPLDWDQRNTLNLTLALSEPSSFSTSAVIRYGSGQPYTPSVFSLFGAGQERNSGRKPAGLLVDVRAEKYFQIGGTNMSVFARVFNLFDTRYFNGPVFASTGSPFYTLNPAVNRTILADPTRFYAPRRFELGLAITPQL